MVAFENSSVLFDMNVIEDMIMHLVITNVEHRVVNFKALVHRENKFHMGEVCAERTVSERKASISSKERAN